MTGTPRTLKFWTAASVALVATISFTGSALAHQGADDQGRAGDTSGRCDEAEHANDPRCASVMSETSASTTAPDSTTTTTSITSGAIESWNSPGPTSSPS